MIENRPLLLSDIGNVYWWWEAGVRTRLLQSGEEMGRSGP